MYVGFHGISAVADTGIVTFHLAGSRNGNDEFSIQQNILIEPGYYGQDAPLTVDPTTIQPEVVNPEQELVENITKIITPNKYWDGKFQYPVDEPCFSADFGGSRIYNNTYEYYHTGIDFNVCSASNTNIYAAASGTVVFAGPLVVRGNAVIIDHGWGVYSGYWHQSQIAVKVGDIVKEGQLIGYIGNTGRSTGFHLHFEIWVNGAQVDPTDWLTSTFPQILEEN
jgi:murein DD-endopeptidase MepM/ murein hydrolase activator NlpD